MIEIKPDLKNFISLAGKHNLIVLSHTFFADWLTPLPVYHTLLKKLKGESFLLESVEGEERISRFSFLGFQPIAAFKNKGKKVWINVSGEPECVFETDKDPVYEIKKLMSRFRAAPKEHLRFFGGFVGYFGYDNVRFFEPIGKQLPDTLNTFDSYFILPKYLIVFDHIKRQIEILSFLYLPDNTQTAKLYQQEKENIAKLFQLIINPPNFLPLSFSNKPLKINSNVTKRRFISAVNKAKEYIRNGDIIQVVLSQRFSVEFNGDPFMAYRYLRIMNASPYMYFLNFNDAVIVGASPEMLLRVESDELITRPIAGTRKRGKNDAEDKQLEENLLNDEKERAEHIMLVDLARNDLGRVARKASVYVPIFMAVERFSHVMHIVSEVRAKMDQKDNIFSALKNCFPAGTVSGAPKVRAMQIINELEPEKRGIYAGSVGYFSFTKSLDTCIIIRTIVFKNKCAYVQAGAGIVSDSQPEKEYCETLNKAKAQILALNFAAGEIVSNRTKKQCHQRGRI